MNPQEFPTINGQTHINAAGIALLVGETEASVTVELRKQHAITPGRFRLPKHWLRQSKELQAHLGTADLAEFVALREAQSRSTEGADE